MIDPQAIVFTRLNGFKVLLIASYDIRFENHVEVPDELSPNLGDGRDQAAAA